MKLTYTQQQRLRRLLHMEYLTTELAKELDCQRRVIEFAVEEGCPHRRDGKQVYIVGDEFAKWYKQSRPVYAKVELADDEAFCLRCKAPRKFVVDTVEPNSPGVELVQGRCVICGAKVNQLRKAVRE
ncbi:MAG: hypothetical protein JXA21_01785 [Anaerolineae bacterium]|nr:hypothetical protein [Anaerolineae bacterium]